MKNQLLVLVVIFSTTAIIAQETTKIVYSSPNLKEVISKHKIIAVLPFKVSIRYKKTPKNYDEQTNKDEENALSYNLQNNFCATMSIKKDIFPIKVLNVETTNSILSENNMLDKLDSYSPQQIAKILGVDGIVNCEYSYIKTNSEVGAMIKEYLWMSNKVALGEFSMAIFNGEEGELLWRFNKTMKQEYGSYPNVIIERMFSKIGRNFPYQK